MSEFVHDSLRLHYEACGSGPPVLLLHGGVSSLHHNYGQFGWVDALTGVGRQVIGLDFRGHGGSDRPHDPACYGTRNLAGDALALLDHLGLARASLVGYSIGAAVALRLLQEQGARFDRAVLVAAGDGLVGHLPYRFDDVLPQLAAVFARAEYPQDLPRHQSAYWKILEAVGGDRLAMLALTRASYPAMTPAQAAAIDVPTLVISGALDQVLGQGPRLAAALGRGQYLEIADANHFALAMSPAVRDAVVGFLQDASAASGDGRLR